MLSDDELVEQIKSGDEQSAEELIKRYYTSILRMRRAHMVQTTPSYIRTTLLSRLQTVHTV